MKKIIMSAITLASTVSYAITPTFEKITCKSNVHGSLPVQITLSRKDAMQFTLSLSRGGEHVPERRVIDDLQCESADTHLAVDPRVVACTVGESQRIERNGLYYVAISQNRSLGVGSPTLSTPGSVREHITFVVRMHTPELFNTNAQTEYIFQAKECSIEY